MNTAAHTPFGYNVHFKRVADGNEVVEDFVRHGFVENTFVAEIQKVVFQRFEFNARLVGYVFDGYRTKVGQSRYWTDRRKF